MQDTETLIQKAILAKIFPGAVLAVSLKGKAICHTAFGMADIFSGTQMQTHTFCDLASLTKPLATTLCLMRLVQDGKLALDQPLAEILPVLTDSGKAKITLRQLLNHTAGLPDWCPWYIQLMKRPLADRKAFLQRLLTAEPLLCPPGKKTLYSDLGFMLLEWVIETTSNFSLDRLVKETIYLPLGITDLFFVDRQNEAPAAAQFAATQLCPWRGRLLKGQVDDDNTWAMGGTSGQAGLFGTAQAVSTLLNTLLATLAGDGRPDVLPASVIRQFMLKQTPRGRALGFDVPTRPGSSSGRFFSDSSVGHLGFTGTSFWADPERSLVVVLLTNRVHPFRFAGGIRTFRAVLHDQVVQELGLA